MSVKDNFSVAATLSQLRYLVFQGMKGDTGDSAYEEAVKLGFVGTEEEWIASLKGEPGANGRDGQDGAPGAPGTPGRDGVSPAVQTSTITGGHRVTITDAAHPQGQSFDVMDGEDGAGAEDAVRYDEQMALSDTQKATARTNIGAVGELEYDALESDIKSLEAGLSMKLDAADAPTKVSDLQNDTGFVTAQQAAAAAPVQSVNGKTGSVTVLEVPDYSDAVIGYILAKTGAGTLGWIAQRELPRPTESELRQWLAELGPEFYSDQMYDYIVDSTWWDETLDGDITHFYAALAAAARAGKLPAVTASDNGKFLRVADGAWAADTVPSYQGGSY